MALALATRPRVLLLDEPLAGLAAAERERVGRLIKGISADLPVLLVEHDIDRVFALADAVTVMNDGEVLVDGTVEDARYSPRVQEVYIGSGAHALAETRAAERRAREHAAAARGRQHLLRQEPHPARRRASTCARTRSSPCSAATARASRRCSRPSSASRRPASGTITLGAARTLGAPRRRREIARARRRLRAAGPRPLRRHDGGARTWSSGASSGATARACIWDDDEDLRVLPAHQGALALARPTTCRAASSRWSRWRAR